MRILVIEDEKKVASFIKRGLKEQSYAVDVSYDGEDGLHQALTNEYDLIILDLMLPKMRGLEVLKKLRAEKVMVPVLILTARSSVENKIEGLDSGGDDYLVKPFAFGELLARVRVLIRRSPAIATVAVLNYLDLKLDLVAHKVSRSDKPIELTSKEFALLEYFMRHPNKVLTRTMIAEHVWDINFDTYTNLIDVYVTRLRKKINQENKEDLIQTIRGTGYVLGKLTHV